MEFLTLIIFSIFYLTHGKTILTKKKENKTHLEEFEDSSIKFCQRTQFSINQLLHQQKFLSQSDFSHVNNWCECMPSGLIICQMNYRGPIGFQIEFNKKSFYGIQNRLKILKIDLRDSGVDATLTEDSLSLIENLSDLEILGVKSLIELPDLTSLTHLFKLSVKLSDIEILPSEFCLNKPHLTVVEFSFNKIKNAANLFTDCEKLSYLDLSHNQLSNIKQMFKKITELQHLDLSYNLLTKIGKYDLEYLVNLKYLIIGKNQLNFINENAFDKLSRLYHLDLSENRLRSLPERSLVYTNLAILNIKENRELFYFPDETQFSSLNTLTAHYPYHCCYFHNREIILKDSEFDEIEVVDDYYFINETSQVIKCAPEPNSLSPCKDLLEDWFMRISVWILSIIGIVSNVMVVIYNLIHNIYYYNSNYELDVPAFLLGNLATSDSLMSVYLLFIAFEDVRTRNEFQKSALVWQHSLSCNLAGFLSVSSSISSALLLSFVTFERYYSIKNSIDYMKRINIKMAFLITLLIWSISALGATLPLFEFNSYSSFAICLPLETRYHIDQIYLISLNSLLVLCFITIFVFYLLIFLNTIIQERRTSLSTCNNTDQIKVRNSEDQKLARNISMLIMVNIICWGPVVYLCVYSLITTSVIDRYIMKFTAVFIIPFNSFINPFLYCISRRNFRVLIKTALDKISFKRKFSNLFSRNSVHSTVTVHSNL